MLSAFVQGPMEVYCVPESFALKLSLQGYEMEMYYLNDETLMDIQCYVAYHPECMSGMNLLNEVRKRIK